ncbi:MAG: diacylglycerol kinase family protein [Anaerolineales bacterium]|nr:diacylglycerol kinase family protein [Anaerolineales bacterium]
MISFLGSRLRAIAYALEGWWHVLRTQRNTWVHASLSIAVIILGFWLRLSPQDWAIIILTMALVWAAEFFNTALEALTDLIQPEEHELAKVSKDVSAAAVLITAAASVLIGLLILGPPLWEKVRLIIGDQ